MRLSEDLLYLIKLQLIHSRLQTWYWEKWPGFPFYINSLVWIQIASAQIPRYGCTFLVNSLVPAIFMAECHRLIKLIDPMQSNLITVSMAKTTGLAGHSPITQLMDNVRMSVLPRNVYIFNRVPSESQQGFVCVCVCVCVCVINDWW